MAPVTLQTLTALADKVGATLTRQHQGRHEMLFADAPVGMTWTGGVHCILAEWVYGVAADRRTALCRLREQMLLGVSPCQDAECETCHPVSTASFQA